MSDAPAATCPDCGTPARQEGQSFCDSCGGFLRWDSSPATSRDDDSSAKNTPEVDTTPPPRSAPAPKDGGTIQGGRPAPADGPARGQAAGPSAGRTSGEAGGGTDAGPGAGSGPQGGPHGSHPAPAPHPRSAPAPGPYTEQQAPGPAGRPASAPLPPAGPMPGEAAPGAAPAQHGYQEPDTESTVPLPPAPGDRRARRGADDDWPLAQNSAEPAAQSPAEPAEPAEPTEPTQPTPTAPPAQPGADWEPHRPAEPPNRSDTAIRALLVPVPEATPPAAPPEAPGSVLPGRPETQRPRVRTPGVPMADFGDPCRYCGTVNPPRRHFCRQCASPLSDERDAIAEGPYAGQRPRLHREHGRWVTRILLTLLLVGVIVGGVFGGPPAARAIQDHFAKRVPVHPTSWADKHHSSKHEPEQAGDGYSNTWWGTGYAGDSAGQWIEARFQQPTDLLAMLVTPGSSARSAQSADEARPMDFDLIVTDSAGKTHTSHHTLNDGGVQKVDVRVRNAVTARFVIRSAYGTGKDKQVAIAELEFYRRATNSN